MIIIIIIIITALEPPINGELGLPAEMRYIPLIGAWRSRQGPHPHREKGWNFAVAVAS